MPKSINIAQPFAVTIICSFLVSSLFLIHYLIASVFILALAVFVLFVLSKDKLVMTLSIMVLLFFFYPYQYIPQLNLMNVLNPFVFLGLIFFIYSAINRDKARTVYKNRFIDICYLIFFIVGIIGAMNTKSSLGAINWLMYSFLTGYLIFKGIFKLTEDKIDRVLDLFLICGLCNLLYGLFEFIKQYSFILREPTSRFTSLLGHPLINAFVYGILFILAIQRFHSTSKKIYLIPAVLFILVIVLTKSRGAWFALLLILLISILRFGLKSKYVFFLFMLALLILPLSPLIMDRLSEREDLRHSSWDVRIQSLSIGAQMLNKSPVIGIGLFNTPRYKHLFTSDDLYSRTSFENSYFQILIETGVLGAIPYFLIIIYILIKTFISKRNDNFGFSCIVFFIFLNSLTFNILNVYRAAHFIYWLFLAIALMKTRPLNTGVKTYSNHV